MTARLVLCLFLFAIAGDAGYRPLAGAYATTEPSGRVRLHVEVVLSYSGNTLYRVHGRVLDAAGAAVASGSVPVEVKRGRGGAVLELQIPNHRNWSAEQPNLYRALTRLTDFRGVAVDEEAFAFGFRQVERRGNQIHWNGRPIFLRGFSGEFLQGGDHGCMTTDAAYIRKRIGAAKAYGFNAERHHSHYPPETYLDVADELGLLQQLEIHPRLRQGPTSPEFAETHAMWERMIVAGRRHPSVVVYSMGNELYANEPALISAMDQLYDVAKKLDPRTLVLNRSGSLPGNDAAGKYDLIERPIGEYEHSSKLAGAAFQAYLRGDRAGRAREFPVIAHEYPLVSAFPRVDKKDRYPSTPEWIVVAEEKARRAGYFDQMALFARNSEAIQWRVIKQMIEEARKFPELAGYSMLRLHDSGGLVGGILNDFSDPKSAPAETFLRANAPTALISDWEEQTLLAGQQLDARLFLSHHQSTTVRGSLFWKVMEASTEWASGEAPVEAPGFGLFPLMRLSVKLPAIVRPAHIQLHAEFRVAPSAAGAAVIENAWDFWVFPQPPRPAGGFALYDPGNRLSSVARLFPGARKLRTGRMPGRGELLLTDSWPDWMDQWLEAGGRLFLLADKNWREPEEMGNHGTHLAFFTSRAPVSLPELDEPLTHWLTIPSNYDRRWGNSGTVVARHPALGDFPHEGFCDFQFFRLIRRAKSFWLDRFPTRPEPIIRAIDNFRHGNNKSYLFEFRVGRGSVLASSLNFTQHIGRAPEADYLLAQLIRYASGGQFEPQIRFSAAELRRAREDFAHELPEVIRRIGDANVSPVRYRYNSLSGEMN